MFQSGLCFPHDHRSDQNVPNLMVRQSSAVVLAFELRCPLDFLHHWGVSVEAGDASISLVPLSETQSGSPRELILPGM